jgi:kynurenine formamidase
MMECHITIADQRYRVLLNQAQSIAIPLQFSGKQPRHFGAKAASATPMQAGNFVGDTRREGSCNVPVIEINPHCNGTHLETISHIVNERVTVNKAAPELLLPCSVISVLYVRTTDDHYYPPLKDDDTVIDKATLEAALQSFSDEWLQALVIRTLPNLPAKLSADYGPDWAPPFFTLEAMRYLRSRNVQHLLVDFPSLDRMYDDGWLSAHHLFWQVGEGSHAINDKSRLSATVSEMIFVPDNIVDGHYLLNLQVPAFELDVAPCRPVLIPLESY